MSPSDLSWLQNCLFFFLGVVASWGLNRCQNRRTKHETSDVDPITILIDNGTTPTPIDDAHSSESDEEARPPPYAPEVIPFDYYNQETKYSSQRISVNIHLTRRGFIDNRLINGLQRQGLSCEVRGSVITVSGYPADDGVNRFLALVQRISGDEGASIV